MLEYTLLPPDEFGNVRVIRVADGASIMADERNKDYQVFLAYKDAWLEANPGGSYPVG